MTAAREPSIAGQPPISFGEQLYNTLNGRRDNNGKITKQLWIDTANELFQIASAAKKRKPKGAPRERNPLWDALATACGMNLAEITRIPAKEIGVALADILHASPDVTPDEIKRRVEGYRRKYPGISISPFAMAKHWPEFGTARGQMTKADPHFLHSEPPPAWRKIAATKWPDSKNWITPTDFATVSWWEIRGTLGNDILRVLLAPEEARR